MDELWRTAMTGTARAGDGTLALADHPATALVDRVEAVDRERRLLLAAGAAAIHRTAGHRLQTDTPAVGPAPAESQRTASHRVGAILRQLADANEKQLLLGLAGRLKSAGLLLPADFLPTALDFSDKSLRKVLRPLLGERGRWLALFRSEWHWATDDAATATGDDVPRLLQQWTEGTHAERCLALTLLHRAEPEQARRLLADVWSTEKAAARGDLLDALRPNLSSADEGMLEGALDDRAAGVRHTAAGLLARLPQSQLSRRMIARADAIIAGTMSGLTRKRLVITCTPPQEVDAALERDGVPPKPPASVGLRAYALMRILAAVRPSHWSQRFQAEPAAILGSVAKDDFADAAIAGWTDAAIAFAEVDAPSADWLAPLGAHWEALFTSAGEDGSRVALERLKAIMERMSAADAERLVLRLLKSAGIRLKLVLATLLPLVPTPWGESFARELLSATRSHVSKFDGDRVSPWINVLQLAADAVPDPLLTAELEVWTIREGDTWQLRGVRKAADRLTQRVQLRRSFLTLLNAESTN